MPIFHISLPALFLAITLSIIPASTLEEMLSSSSSSSPSPPPLPPPSRVAVLMSGNIHSFPFFKDSVMPAYHRYFRHEGYDLFIAVGDPGLRTEMRSGSSQPLESVSEAAFYAASRGGSDFNPPARAINILSMPYLFSKTKAGGGFGAGYCMSNTTNHIVLLMMAHKMGVAFAQMRRAEMNDRRLYDYAVRMRPDARVVRRLPHVKELFDFYRRANSTGKNLASLRNQFGGLAIPPMTQPPEGLPLAADVITWDDQFGIASRARGAEALFLGAQTVYSKCFNASSWAAACGKYVADMQKAIDHGGVGCCPMRLISVEFDDVIVRDCGNLQTNARYYHGKLCEPEGRTGPESCMMTTGHWKGPCPGDE